jgi:DNA-binding response OmpR family regulator
MCAVKATKSKRILHVEDDADNREMVSLMLSEYQVISVETIAAGLVAAKQHDFHLYLIDNQLVDGLGVDLCREIRRFDKDTPIVFCSGFTDDAHQRTALNSGATGILAKPFDRGRLVAVVEKQLAKRRR